MSCWQKKKFSSHHTQHLTKFVLELIGTNWTILEDIGRYWKILEDIGRYWTILDDIGRYWTILDDIGRYWTIIHSFYLLSFSCLSIFQISYHPRLSRVPSTYFFPVEPEANKFFPTHGECAGCKVINLYKRCGTLPILPEQKANSYRNKP